jgi:hypothetical protein
MIPASRKPLLALGLALASFVIPALPAAATPADDSPLGSPAASAALYTTDYAVAVRAALPPVDAATLTRLMDDVARAAASERPLAITSVADLERFFGLRASGQEGAYPRLIDTGDAAYRVDAARQHFFLALNNDGAASQPREVATRNLPDVQAAHADLAARLGIPKEEIFYDDFREILSQADGSPTLEKGVSGEIQAEGALTTLLRALAGVQVEGSFLRIGSLDPKRLDVVDARWPLVRLSSLVGKSGLRSPQDATSAVLGKVTADSSGQPVALHMAVVLRPVDAKEAEFVPSLKVGIQPQAIATKDGFRTDAGEVFYVDLLRDSPPLADPPHQTDAAGEDR